MLLTTEERHLSEKGKDREPHNIVILGASFAGLAVAHKLMREVLKQLGITRGAHRYKVILIGPSTHLYWNIGAPRAIVDKKQLPINDIFVPFEPLFEEYPKTRFEFIQGEASSIDFKSRYVVVQEVHKSKRSSCKEKSIAEVRTERLISFHSLVLATGTSARSPLLSLHGPHDYTVEELQKFHTRIANAKGIIIAGGGCSGVECAGQSATWLNRCKKRGQAVTIMLLSGHDRLLPKLPPKFGAQAEVKLKKLGVLVMHNYRVIQAEPTADGRTKCMLDRGQDDLLCDVYVEATGLVPNTSYMPTEMLTASGYIDADPKSLRVPFYPRVYAIGDCASHSKNSIQDVYDSLPVVLQNLRNDLLTWEIQTEHPLGGGGAQSKLEALEDFEYVQNQTDSQLMPISQYGGVGILFGHKLPSFMVWLMKGRDYRIGRAKPAAGAGKDPYAVV